MAAKRRPARWEPLRAQAPGRPPGRPAKARPEVRRWLQGFLLD